jgi:PAS domain S-box-containing protein
MVETKSSRETRLTEKQKIRAFNRARQGTLIRTAMTLFIWVFAFLAFALRILQAGHIIGISLCVLVLLLINIPYLFALKKTYSLRIFAFLTLLFNLFEVIGYTAVIYLLGGIKALYLSPIYAILISYLGVMAPPRFPFVVAAFSSLSLSGVAALEYYGFLPSMDLHQTPPYPGINQAAIVLAVSVTFFVVALVTAGVTRQVRRNREKLRRQYDELEEKTVELERTGKELRTTQQELEKRVEERTRELKGANDRLLQEIQERRLAEKALKENESRFRHIVESSPLPMGIINMEGRVEYVNPKFSTIFGFIPETVPPLADWFQPSDGNLHPFTDLFKKWQLAIEKTVPETFTDEGFEVDLISKDGSVRTVEIRGAPVGNKVLTVFNDLTERKTAERERQRLEAQLREVQKLESLGVLAGGIAHDFNNLLMAILGNADLALLSLSPASPVRPHVEDIIRASKRAAELCRQMLAYSGKGQFVIGFYNLSEIVREIAQMIEVSISKKATLRYFFSENLPAVEADATQLRQVIMNLITNASEALGDQNGLISVTTGVQDCDRAYLSEGYLNDTLLPGKYVYLEVSDSGCGMDKETLRRLFDPFFSTKFTGRGLGLAAVLGIIRGHQGAIKVDSEPGKGTCFKILLPAREGDSGGRLSLQDNAPLRSGRVKILLVDDDPFIREVVPRMLKQLGFEVLTATDGQEGLAVYRDRQEEIRCVILDLTMPGMDGKQAFRELYRLNNDLRIILSSGYNEQEVIQQFAGQGPAGFIQKPYTVAALQETLTRVLK